jgi:hypothetical protein
MINIPLGSFALSCCRSLLMAPYFFFLNHLSFFEFVPITPICFSED